MFYLPPEAFGNPEFLRGVKMFFSPDGKSVRFFITHQGDPMTPEGIARVSAERTAAQEGTETVFAVRRQGLSRRNRGDLPRHGRRREV